MGSSRRKESDQTGRLDSTLMSGCPVGPSPVRILCERSRSVRKHDICATPCPVMLTQLTRTVYLATGLENTAHEVTLINAGAQEQFLDIDFAQFNSSTPCAKRAGCRIISSDS